MPHHKLVLSARGDDHCHRRPAEVGSGLPMASRCRPAEVGSGLPRASHGTSQADGATPMATSVYAAAKWPCRRQNGTKRPQSVRLRHVLLRFQAPRARAFKSPDAGASMSSVSSAQASTRPGLKRTTTAWKLSSKKNGGSEAAAQARPRRHPAGRGRHRLPRGGQRRATARCLP